MNLLYNLGIRLMVLAIRLAAVSKPKAKKWIAGRKGLIKKIKNDLKDTEKVVWVHCASLGEFEQGRPLMEEIKRRFPHKKILLTFYSPSGYEVQKNYSGADFVYYLPADTQRNARRFIQYTKPEVVFFIKYEYWYNYLRLLKKKSIPSYFVSTIFREEQLFFKKRGGWYRKMLKYPSHFFLQNETSAKLLESLGYKNFSIAGDTRFDRVAHILDNVQPVKLVENFINGADVMVAGSSWKAEEAIIYQYIRNKPGLKVILVPHVIESENIQRILDLYGNRAILYSEATKSNVSDKQVLIVDNYGMLTTLYQYGKIAFIGGGFGVGIHNVLEAATFGMPILFGPNHEKFAEAVDLVNQSCAFVVNNIEDFNTIVSYLLKDERIVFSIAEKAAEYVRKNVGATRHILEKVF